MSLITSVLILFGFILGIIISFILGKKFAKIKGIIDNVRLTKKALKVIRGEIKNEYRDHEDQVAEAKEFIVGDDKNKDKMITFGERKKIIKESTKKKVVKKKKGKK